ncbi:MAG TPA: hypothetical protein VHE55_06110 [Fimbriimonadaceae bacterium]|nr:hypothetical protein [Fimbriimonadaceae bacterium]
MNQRAIQHLVEHARKHIVQETLQHAVKEEKHSVGAALGLLCVGLFLTPMIIGVPIVIWGAVKLYKAMS